LLFIAEMANNGVQQDVSDLFLQAVQLLQHQTTATSTLQVAANVNISIQPTTGINAVHRPNTGSIADEHRQL